VNYKKSNQPTEQMNYLKKIWKALNTDITPHLQELQNQIAAIYDPQLIPVHSGGVTVEWVDVRTGERPWF
jgi:hypothetical protein